MMHGISCVVGATAVAAALMATTDAARADEGVKAGFLQCNVGAGWSQFVYSARSLDCTYSSASGTTERYTGEIRTYGIDVTYVSEGVMGWAVFAASTSANPGELAGEYGGVKASVAVGLGVGANVLIGGFNNSITLQPVSLDGYVGGGVAVGAASLTLTAAR